MPNQANASEVRLLCNIAQQLLMNKQQYLRINVHRKQFAFRLGDIRSFANFDFNNGLYNTIISVRIPTAMIKQFTVTTTTTFVLQSSVLTIAGS